MESKKRPRIKSQDTSSKEKAPDVLNEFKGFNMVETPVEKEDYVDEERLKWTLDSGEFDWEGYESTCFSSFKKGNPKIKTNKNEKVFSFEPYAQEYYDRLNNCQNMSNLIEDLTLGSIYEGKVYNIGQGWATVDIDYRQLVYIKISKEDPQYQDIKVGEEVSVLITECQTDEGVGHIQGSITAGMMQKVFAELKEGIDSKDTAWMGTVKEMISNGGYIVDVQGIPCFMPGSLAGINKLHDFESIVGTDMYVVPVSFSNDRGTIVVSHRKYLQALIPDAIEDLRENIDQSITGFVTGTAKYGVFCEFNQCLTGMIHVNDLDEETSAAHKSQSIKPGDSITFKIKDIISNKKITLTQKDEDKVNPWLTINSRYKIPSTVEATVKTAKDYGLFISIEEGVVGLLHVSEIGEDLIKSFGPGDKITVDITRIDQEMKRVFLKLPS